MFFLYNEEHLKCILGTHKSKIIQLHPTINMIEKRRKKLFISSELGI